MGGNPSSSFGLLRGTVLAAMSTLLTSMGHVAGGGFLPDIAVLVVLLPLLAGVLRPGRSGVRVPRAQ